MMKLGLFLSWHGAEYYDVLCVLSREGDSAVREGDTFQERDGTRA